MAKQHLEAAQRERDEVEELARELADRRRKNNFGPTLNKALRGE